MAREEKLTGYFCLWMSCVRFKVVPRNKFRSSLGSSGPRFVEFLPWYEKVQILRPVLRFPYFVVRLGIVIFGIR